MPFQVSPGINISERDLTTVVPNVATSIGAIVGNFQWGPVLERQSITTENDLVKTFGEPNDTTFIDFLPAANYLAYSNNLIVVRNISSSARNAAVGDGAVIVQNKDSYDSASFGTQLFVAKYPSVLGNTLKTIVIDSDGWAAAETGKSASQTARNAGTATSLQLDQLSFLESFNSSPGTSEDWKKANGNATTGNDELHVLVIDEDGLFTGSPGEVLERHAFISKASDAKRIDGSSNYIGNILRNESAYVWLGVASQLTVNSVDVGTTVHAGSAKASGVFKRINSATPAEKIPGGSLVGGVDSGTLSAGEYQAAYDLYAEPEVVDVTLIMAGGSSALSQADSRTVASHISSLCETRKDCVAFISPHIDSVVRTSGEVDKIVADKTAMSSSSYAVMDSSWKYQYDRYNDVFRFVPMNADIAGLCARTDFTHDAWYSPAGYNRGTIKNIVKLSWEPTKADRDVMYQAGINPLTTQTGAGIILFGDKTAQTLPSAFDRINVRRLFIVLEKAIAIAAKAMLFEFNDEFTRSQFVNIVSPFLREIQGRRGITDFKVVCDSSNNTGQVIDTNNFVGDIYIKPSRSINFIQLNFIAARTDVSFSEIGG
tara:strand:+ start:54 stop:1853 length:1800 start_codon:yes stop_codon:yes gene_type:complete